MSVNWAPTNALASRPRSGEWPRPRPARSRPRSGTVEQLLQRVRAEYREMPGLSLTPVQACCLWNVNEAICARLLAVLVQERFLVRTSHGTYVLATDDT